MDPAIFKAYDIRGIYPTQINEDTVAKIGYFYVKFTKVINICVGRDIRISSPILFEHFVKGALLAGAKVTDLGVIATDMVYFATAKYGFDGGVQITASHNPKEYNGVKLVLRDAKPLSGDSGIYAIRDLVLGSANQKFDYPASIDGIEKLDIKDDYINHVLSFVDKDKIKGLKVVIDAGNGIAGTILPDVFSHLGCELIPLYFEPDGNFPNHQAEPLDEENVKDLEKLVVERHADLGVAYDGDADRCFFIDEKGGYSTGYFITAMLAKNILKNHPGEKIIHDPRQIWAIEDTINSMGGVSIISKAGHAFIKERMRQENAIFAGELSSHFYFRENYYADNGMIPMLMMLEHIITERKPLSQLLAYYRSKYFASPEINYKVSDVSKILAHVEEHYKDKASRIYHIDGLSVDFLNWRFNLRGSNTEPLIRLNAEAKSQEILDKQLKEVESVITSEEF